VLIFNSSGKSSSWLSPFALALALALALAHHPRSTRAHPRPSRLRVDDDALASSRAPRAPNTDVGGADGAQPTARARVPRP
jgi:hypothetical protein